MFVQETSRVEDFKGLDFAEPEGVPIEMTAEDYSESQSCYKLSLGEVRKVTRSGELF